MSSHCPRDTHSNSCSAISYAETPIAAASEKKRKFELPNIWQATKRFAVSATAMFGSPNPSSNNNDQPPPQNEEGRIHDTAAARAQFDWYTSSIFYNLDYLLPDGQLMRQVGR